jgi:hypothetical protein
MTSDARATSAFDTLAEHLRQGIGAQVKSVLDELAAAALADRDRAVADARSQIERVAQERSSADAASVATRAREEGRVEGFAAGEAKAKAEAEAEQQAAAATPAAAESIDAKIAARLVDSIQAIGRARSLSDILDALVDCAGREAARASVFLVRGSQLRAWRLAGFGPVLDEDTSLEFSLDQAGVIASAVRTGAAASGDAASAPAFASFTPGQACIAIPLVLSGDTVAVLYADQGSHPAWTSSVEVLTRHAARCLEAMTAFKAAQAIMEQPALASSAAADDHAADDDASARRYARLLVSEIKLYHEPAVVAGRRDGDLGARLSAEIGRARVLYEQRVPPAVRHRADYFHDELVRTLANGDGRLLGT